MLEQGNNLIIPDYGGALADRIVWNQKALDGFAKAADLRTQIVIQEGDEEPSRTRALDQENLGRILAWKSLSNPFLEHVKKEPPPKEMQTTLSRYRGQREVVINHAFITDRVTRETGGVLDEKKFAGYLNQATRSGLMEILHQEKADMMAKSGIILGINAGLIILEMKLAEYCFRGKLLNFTTASLIPKETTKSFYPAECLLGIIFVLNAAICLNNIFKSMLKDSSHNPYSRTFNDCINPVNHFARMLLGDAYLMTKGRKPLTVK